MIPKHIHYCWFGNSPIPKSAQLCVDSWKRCCPNYGLTLWRENNFDVSQHPYMSEAYEAKRWAFVSDLARLLIIYEHGGVYLDTDVELIRPLDCVLETNRFFFGIEKDTNPDSGTEFIHVATGLGFGAEARNAVIKDMISEYDGAHFKRDNGTLDLTPCPIRNSKVLEKYGYTGKDEFMQFQGGTIYPSEYFNPKEYSSSLTRFTENTVSIHHYDASWKTTGERTMETVKRKIKKFVFKIGGGGVAQR